MIKYTCTVNDMYNLAYRNQFENWCGIMSLPDFFNQLFLLLSLHISAYYVMLMANDIFILVSHHHWEQATKPLHIWCEQNWNLDQVLSARGVSPDWIYFSLFNAIAGGMRNNRNWERFLIILDSLWYFENIYTFPTIQFSQQTFVELEIIEFIVFHLWCRHNYHQHFQK